MRHVISSAAVSNVAAFYTLSDDYTTLEARQAHSTLMLKSDGFLYKQASPPAGLLRSDFIIQTLAAFFQYIDGCSDIEGLYAMKGFIEDSFGGAIGLSAAGVRFSHSCGAVGLILLFRWKGPSNSMHMIMWL